MKEINNSPKFLTLGQNIQEIRKKIGMTQDEFSEKLDITSNFLSKVENGYSGISIDVAINICKIANCSSINLFKGLIDPSDIIDNYELLNSKNKSIVDKMIMYLLESQ